MWRDGGRLSRLLAFLYGALGTYLTKNLIALPVRDHSREENNIVLGRLQRAPAHDHDPWSAYQTRKHLLRFPNLV
jgi:hypothetical protein